MKLRKIGVVLLALLLAAIAMVPMVSAGEILPSEEIITSKYFHDVDKITEYSIQRQGSRNLNEISISEYSLVITDPKKFVKDAEQSKVVWSVKGRDYIIDLKQDTSLIAPDAKLFIKTANGTIVTDLPPIKQYRGTVLGDEKGDALFTVDNNVLLGRVSIGNDTYLIDQFGTLNDGKMVQIVYNVKNEIASNNGLLPSGDDIYLPPVVSSKTPVNSDTEKARTDATLASTATSTVRILAVYDAQFHNLYPSTSSSEVTSMLAAASNAFSPNYIGVNFQIAGIASDSTLTSTNKDTLLTQLRDSESSIRDSTSSDLVFLFTGRDLDGTYIGNSVLFSSGVQELSAYGLAQMVSSGSYTASSYQKPILVAHELGHNFGAMHQDLYPGTDGYPYYVPTYARAKMFLESPTGIYRYTSLYSPFQTGTLMSCEYSSPNTGHGDSTHDNARRISETKSTVAGYR